MKYLDEFAPWSRPTGHFATSVFGLERFGNDFGSDFIEEIKAKTAAVSEGETADEVKNYYACKEILNELRNYKKRLEDESEDEESGAIPDRGYFDLDSIFLIIPPQDPQEFLKKLLVLLDISLSVTAYQERRDPELSETEENDPFTDKTYFRNGRK